MLVSRNEKVKEYDSSNQLTKVICREGNASWTDKIYPGEYI